jgi:hypothetical protein
MSGLFARLPALLKHARLVTEQERPVPFLSPQPPYLEAEMLTSSLIRDAH